MDLKTFVSESLVGIVEGVLDAQAKLKASGQHRARIGFENALTAEIQKKPPLVEFDVALQVSDESGKSARIGVLGALVASVEGDAKSGKESSSRLRFSVPLIMYHTDHSQL